MNPTVLSPAAMKKAKELAYRQVAERCKVDLFFLNKYILNCDIEDEFVHGYLCKATRPLLYWKDKAYAKKFDFASDWGRTEEQGLPNEAEKEEFFEKMRDFLPGDRDEETGEYELEKMLDMDLHQLLALVPRGTLKTTVVTIGFVLQWFLVHPESRVLIDSETSTNSVGFLGEIKGHLEGNEAYREVFFACHGVYPDRYSRDKQWRWTNSAIDIGCRTRQIKEPSIDTGGVDTTKNSRHYDLIVFDDLHSEINTQTKEQIEKVKTHFKLAFSLLDPGCPVIVIGTRWDFNDLYQMILDELIGEFNLIARKAVSTSDQLLYPTKLSKQFLDGKRSLQGAYIFSCNPAGSKITMADWSRKNIEDVKPGDMVVGWNLGTRHKKSRLQPSKVLQIGNRVSPIVKVTLASGKIFHCTPDHHWYVNPTGVGKSRYLPAKVGRKLMKLEIKDIAERDDWLSGMFDGEGSCGGPGGNIIRLAQSRTYNPEVCAEIERKLNHYGFKWGYNGEAYYLNGGLRERVRFLNLTRPIRQQKIIDSTWVPDFIKEKDTVVSIEDAGEAVVYSMQTETGNYICHDILSRNCQYMNEPVDAETAKFKREYFQYRNWAEVEGMPMNCYLTIDPGGDGKASDFAAFVVSYMDYQDNLYVRYIVKAKMTEGEIVEMTINLFRKFGPKRVVVETLAGAGKSIITAYKTKMKDLGIWLPIQYIEHRVTAKTARIEALAPKYEFGHVFHIRECPKIKDLEYELLKFPKAQNDDVSDAFATVLEVASAPLKGKAQHQTDEARRKKFKKLNAPRSTMIGY